MENPYPESGDYNLKDMENPYPESGDYNLKEESKALASTQKAPEGDSMDYYNLGSSGSSLGDFAFDLLNGVSQLEKDYGLFKLKTDGKPTGFGEDINNNNNPASMFMLSDLKDMTEEQARAELQRIGPTISGNLGDYSDLSTFDDYNFGSSPFDLDYFKKIAEAAGGGKQTQGASDLNVMSGAGANTFRFDPDNPPVPAVGEGEGVSVGEEKVGVDEGNPLNQFTQYVTQLPSDFDYGFTGIAPPQQVTTQMPSTPTSIVPPTKRYTANMLSQATPTLSSEQLMGLGTDEEQTLAEYLSLLDNADSVG